MQLCLTNIFWPSALLSCLCCDDHQTSSLISSLAGEQGKKKVFITFKDKQNIGQNLTVYLGSIFKKVGEAGCGSKGVPATENACMEKYIAKCEGIVNTRGLMCSSWGDWRITVLQHQKPEG